MFNVPTWDDAETGRVKEHDSPKLERPASSGSGGHRASRTSRTSTSTRGTKTSAAKAFGLFGRKSHSSLTSEAASGNAPPSGTLSPPLSEHRASDPPPSLALPSSSFTDGDSGAPAASTALYPPSPPAETRGRFASTLPRPVRPDPRFTTSIRKFSAPTNPVVASLLDDVSTGLPFAVNTTPPLPQLQRSVQFAPDEQVAGTNSGRNQGSQAPLAQANSKTTNTKESKQQAPSMDAGRENTPGVEAVDENVRDETTSELKSGDAQVNDSKSISAKAAGKKPMTGKTNEQRYGHRKSSGASKELPPIPLSPINESKESQPLPALPSAAAEMQQTQSLAPAPPPSSSKPKKQQAILLLPESERAAFTAHDPRDWNPVGNPVNSTVSNPVNPPVSNPVSNPVGNPVGNPVNRVYIGDWDYNPPWRKRPEDMYDPTFHEPAGPSQLQAADEQNGNGHDENDDDGSSEGNQEYGIDGFDLDDLDDLDLYDDDDDFVDFAAADDEENAANLDLIYLKHEVRRLARAMPDTILYRLRRKIDARDVTGKMEMKRYLLWTIYNVLPMREPESSGSSAAAAETPEAGNVLALFEDNGTTSYVSAIHNEATVYHLSPEPLQDQLFTNIEPLRVRAVSSTEVALPAGAFAAVYSLRLPALLPSFSMSQILGKIAESLVPGGALHLLVADPLPVAGSAGDFTRDWLDEHLFPALAGRFLSKTPAAHARRWLRNAGLWGPGSGVRTVRWMAITDKVGAGSPRKERAGQAGEASVEDVLVELRDAAGRMLWEETWGGLVQGGRRWWEDAGVVVDCLEKATMFDYHIIKAVREA